VHLAKPHLDVGLFTNNTDAMLAFWRDHVRLPYEEMLPMGGGLQQHRFGMNGSVLKVNSVRDAMQSAPPAGYRELLIAREGVEAPQALTDPDGNALRLVPHGHEGVTGMAVRMAVRDAGAHAEFWAAAMEMEPVAANTYRCGDTLLMIEQRDDAVAAGRMQSPGYRYLTAQVWEVDVEHAAILARGGNEGRPPVTLGTTARISFVRDPDGNWIEISQRASLTGPLPAE
jgi:lactoylglutathione lyase